MNKNVKSYIITLKVQKKEFSKSYIKEIMKTKCAFLCFYFYYYQQKILRILIDWREDLKLYL